jgi:putative Ca2+/H+ antiporter (TMEM165/GDT1 family)
VDLVWIGVVLAIALVAAVIGIRIGILVAHRLDRRLAARDQEDRRGGAERGE